MLRCIILRVAVKTVFVAISFETVKSPNSENMLKLLGIV